MAEYGVMPWHFGGPETLTRREVEALFEYDNKKRAAEEKAAKEAKKQSPRRR